MKKTAIINARIYTMTGRIIESGSVLWEEDRIIAVGENLDLPSQTEVLDERGNTVVPGYIDAHTHLGILEEIYQMEGDDLNEMTEPVTPELRALDGVNPYDLGFKDAIKGGITTVMTGPGSANVVCGTTMVLKTVGECLQDMVLIEQSGLKVAFGENPKRVYGEQKKMPSTRMGIAALLRQAFIDTKDYLAKKEKAEKENELVEHDLGFENLALVLKGKIPLRAHVHRADDIATAIRIADEFQVKMVLEHGTEAHKNIKDIVKRDIPVVLGPTLSSRSKVELAEMNWETAALLSKAGVLVALTTDHSVIPVQYLPLCAALAVRHGMDEQEALKAITINPARILGLDDRIGSLKEGKDADMLVLSGHPLDWRTKIKRVYVNGKEAYASPPEV